MSKEKYKISQFVKNINELFKQNKYQDIKDEFENSPPDLNSFYSLSARLKYIHSIVLRKITKSYQLWFQESSICFSPNYLRYIPENYFDEWIENFYSVGSEISEQWLPPGLALKSVNNENTFLKVNASFSKKIVFEGDPAEIKVSIISTLPKEIQNASIAVQYSIKSTSDNSTDDDDNNDNYQGKQKMLIIAKRQSIIPNKKLFFRSSVSLSDQSNSNAAKVILTDVILIINSIKLIFEIEPLSMKSNRTEYPNRSREIRIEPKDIGCTLVANLPPPGFVDVPAPIHLKFSTSDFAGYSIILSVTCPQKDKKDTYISLNPDMSGEMDKITIDVEKPFKEYNLTFYAFSHIPKEINLQLKWYDQRDGKNGKVNFQELPLEFHFPFILKTKFFTESSSCRTEVNVRKTPLLTDSSYSILTEFTSNCPWPITIKSFEIVPEKENQKDEEDYIRRRLSNIDSDIPESELTKNNPAINFQKPIINLPIMLEPNDRFSAFTKFSTGNRTFKSINLGSLLIRYFMHSAIYKGTHLYIFKLPSSENIVINKRDQSSLTHITNISNNPRKSSINPNNKKTSKLSLNNKGNRNYFSRNSCNIPNPKILNNIPCPVVADAPEKQNIISIEKLKLQVEFDFPSRGSQFEMCELTIKMTNVSETPLEIVLDIKPSKNFLMAGTLSTQIGLFPFDPAQMSLKFFPLAHGSLTFPEITINSAQSWDYCYWSAKPTIFISYPVAS